MLIAICIGIAFVAYAWFRMSAQYRKYPLSYHEEWDKAWEYEKQARVESGQRN